MQKHDQTTFELDQPINDKGLPPVFQDWFASKGWRPRDHQLKLLEHVQSNNSCLLIAPTGAGKTMAGFMPSLIDLSSRSKPKPGQVKKA